MTDYEHIIFFLKKKNIFFWEPKTIKSIYNYVYLNHINEKTNLLLFDNKTGKFITKS